VDVFLALHDPHRVTALERLEQLRKAVRDTSDLPELPIPPAWLARVRASLRELLVRGPAHLEQQVVVLVHVVVDRDGITSRCPLRSRSILSRLADLLPRQPELLEHGVSIAAGVAVEENWMLVASGYGQARVAVFVSRAAGHEAAAGRPQGLEAREHEFA
jgi:hypothetical protein